MMFSSRTLASLLFLATIAQAGNKHLGSKRGDHKARSHNINVQTRQDSRVFTLTDRYEGATFFDEWNFETFPDPTHGLVTYVDRDTAFAEGLAYVRDDGVAIMKVDNNTFLAEGEHRKSVRIHTKKEWTEGLFIADILQMPYGCSVWPAYWSNGPAWPSNGEIDIIEGVHNTTQNRYTLHTSPGCFLDTSKHNPGATSFKEVSFTGEIDTTNCDANVDFNTGCGIKDTAQNSYGFGLNSNGGGVYATLWTADGISIWYFPRDRIPEDINSEQPNPDSWPAPQAFWSSSSCPMNQFFNAHTFIFNITLCGDLGEATYSGAGCPGTCAQAVTDPANFKTAKWKVNYFRVYN